MTSISGPELTPAQALIILGSILVGLPLLMLFSEWLKRARERTVMASLTGTAARHKTAPKPQAKPAPRRIERPAPPPAPPPPPPPPPAPVAKPAPVREPAPPASPKPPVWWVGKEDE